MSDGAVFLRERKTATVSGKLRKAPPSALIWAWQALSLLDAASAPSSAQEALESVLAELPEADPLHGLILIGGRSLQVEYYTEDEMKVSGYIRTVEYQK